MELNIPIFNGHWTKIKLARLLPLFAILCFSGGWSNSDPAMLSASNVKELVFNDNDDLDDDDDGILDTVEDANTDGDNDHTTNPTDSDGDGVANYLDLDSDNDGILDNVEGQTSAAYVPPSGVDANGNGLDDAYEGTYGFGIVPVNSDRGLIPDYLDIDSDIDGIRDNIEAQAFDSYVAPSGIDANGNGLDDAYEGSYGFGINPISSDNDAFPDWRDFDSDGDGIKDKREAQTSTGYIGPSGDSNGNDIDDSYENGLSPIDTDGDMIPDYRDSDADNDGLLDNREGQTIAGYIAPSGLDSNRDGLDNAYESAGLIPIDTDGDTDPDYRDLDSDDDGCPDAMEGSALFDYDQIDADGALLGTVDSKGIPNIATGGQNNVSATDANIQSQACQDNDLDAVDDVTSTPENTAVEIDILANDSGVPTDGTLTVTDPANGTVTINDGGTPDDPSDDTVTYTPDPSIIGEDSFEYTICDGAGNCDTATVTVEVGTPDDLDAVDDVASTPEDTAVEIDILANDSGVPTDGTLTVTGPANGAVTINDGGTPGDPSDDTVTYTPGTSFNGEDSFEYTICDGAGNCDTATVTVEVGMPDDLDAVDDVASTPEDTAVEIDILANDSGVPTDGTLTVTDPANGTVTINDGGTPDNPSDDTVTYTPDPSIIGEDSFEYTICDGAGNCDTATVTVEVGMPDDLDAVDDVASTPEDTAVEIDILANDSGVPTDGTLTVTGPANGAVTINDGGTPDDPSDDTVTYTPGTSFNGEDSFEYTICDGTDNCDTATVTITVGTMQLVIDAVDDDFSTNPVNGLSGGDIVGSNVLDNDTLFDLPVDPADIILTSTPTGPLTINPDGTVTVAPNTPAGTYTIEYTICYEEIEIPTKVTTYCDTATVTVVVEAAVIDAVDDDFSDNTVDGDFGGTVADSNVFDNDTLNGVPLNPEDITLTSEPTGPLTINSDGTVTVASNTAEGTYTIDYTICENLNPGNCDTATVTVEVISGIILVNQLVTPNGDGKNDFLFIKGVLTVPTNSLKIFNRWGVAVYEGSGYNNQNNIFDGRSKGRSTLSVDDYLPAGVYFYIFEYQKNQDNITDSGYLYLSK